MPKVKSSKRTILTVDDERSRPTTDGASDLARPIEMQSTNKASVPVGVTTEEHLTTRGLGHQGSLEPTDEPRISAEKPLRDTSSQLLPAKMYLKIDIVLINCE